jgi:plasmid maintenance system antidote protein VapI
MEREGSLLTQELYIVLESSIASHEEMWKYLQSSSDQ